MDVKKLSKCAICNDSFRRPVVLPCGHSQCEECIEEWAKNAGKKDELQDSSKQEEKLAQGGDAAIAEPSTVSCPSCRQIHQIPEGGVRKFTRNYDLISSEPTCDWCEEKEASVRCRECEIWLCSFCRENCHNVAKKNRSHAFFLVKEVLAGDMKPLFRVCKKHGKELIKFYCVSCSEPCCHSGGATVHKMHECVMLEEQKSEFCEKTEEELRQVDLKHLGDAWMTKKEKLKKQKEELITEVKKRKKIIINQLDQQEDDLIRAINELTDENQEVIDNIEKMERKKKKVPTATLR